MKKTLGIFICSFNNYQLLKNETLKRNNFKNFPILNIDDHSSKKNIILGRKICRENNIKFQMNRKKGLQYATNQAIKYFKKNYNCDWIICIQQDNFMIGNSLLKFQQSIKKNKYKNFGAVGFHHLSEDNLIMNSKIFKEYLAAKKVKGALCIFSLSDNKTNWLFKIKFTNLLKLFFKSIIRFKIDTNYLKRAISASRVFAPYTFRNFKRISKKYNGLFECELPVWSTIAINTNVWIKHIKPRKGYIFHLWFPDIAFQLLRKNIKIGVDSNIYVLNNQKVKEKYGMNYSSADAGREKNFKHAEKYGPHLKIFKKYWGFDYENILIEFPKVRKKFKGTLIEKFFNHNSREGPFKQN